MSHLQSPSRPSLRYHAGMDGVRRLSSVLSAGAQRVVVACLLFASCQSNASDVDEASANLAVKDQSRITGETDVIAATDTRERTLVRELAHVVMSEHCGDCHFDDSPDVVPAALEIFNLNDPLWYTQLDETRLLSSKRRVDEQGSNDDKRVFDQFVATEIQLRRAALDTDPTPTLMP